MVFNGKLAIKGNWRHPFENSSLSPDFSLAFDSLSQPRKLNEDLFELAENSSQHIFPGEIFELGVVVEESDEFRESKEKNKWSGGRAASGVQSTKNKDRKVLEFG